MFTLLAMTLERHKAIMTPLAPRKSHKTLWVMNFTTTFDQSLHEIDLVCLIVVFLFVSLKGCNFDVLQV